MAHVIPSLACSFFLLLKTSDSDSKRPLYKSGVQFFSNKLNNSSIKIETVLMMAGNFISPQWRRVPIFFLVGHNFPNLRELRHTVFPAIPCAIPFVKAETHTIRPTPQRQLRQSGPLVSLFYGTTIPTRLLMLLLHCNDT